MDREVLRAVADHHWNGKPLSGVTEDSRRVRPGMVFVARRGRQVDGHLFLSAARQAGAALTVGEYRLSPDSPDILVSDGGKALAELVSAWYGDPGRNLTLVGITGTNGKTTTAYLTASILAASGRAVGTIGTLGYRFAEEIEEPSHTTPPPETLYRLLHDWGENGATHIVMEASAQALAQGRTAACPFRVAALTNITRDHGEYFRTMDSYRRAKRVLFTELGRDATAVLPSDDPEARPFVAAIAAPTLYYGDGGMVTATEHGDPTLDGTAMVLSINGRGHHVFLPLPGLYNIRNALCASAAAHALGIPDLAIVEGLEKAEPVVGRTVVFETPAGVRAVIDYAHNPAGLVSVLRLLRGTTLGRLCVVMGARGHRDKGKRPLMGAVIAALADELVLTSDRPLSEDPAQAAKPMLTAAQACGLPTRFVRDRAQAIAEVALTMEPRDCLLVSGKGSEPWLGDSAAGPITDLQALRACLPDLALRQIPGASKARRRGIAHAQALDAAMRDARPMPHDSAAGGLRH